MKHHLLTMLILLAALALYAIGMNGGGAVLLWSRRARPAPQVRAGFECTAVRT